MELLTANQDRLKKLLAQLSGVDLFLKKMAMEDERYIPVGLEMEKDALGLEEEKESEYYRIYPRRSATGL